MQTTPPNLLRQRWTGQMSRCLPGLPVARRELPAQSHPCLRRFLALKLHWSQHRSQHPSQHPNRQPQLHHARQGCRWRRCLQRPEQGARAHRRA